MAEYKNGKKNIWTSIFFLSWDYVLNHYHTIEYTVVSIAADFF